MDISAAMIASSQTAALKAQKLGNNIAQLKNEQISGNKTPLQEAAQKAASEFEAVFLTTMLEGMFSGLETKAPWGGGSGEKSYRSLLVGEYAKEMSQSGGIGLADHVYREILAIQESSGS